MVEKEEKKFVSGEEWYQLKVTHGTDEAGIVPAVAQGLQEPIAGINLEVAAVAFGAKHLLIVWREETVAGGEVESTGSVSEPSEQSHISN